MPQHPGKLRQAGLGGEPGMADIAPPLDTAPMAAAPAPAPAPTPNQQPAPGAEQQPGGDDRFAPLWTHLQERGVDPRVIGLLQAGFNPAAIGG